MGWHSYFPCGIPVLWGVHRSGCCQLLGWLHYQQAEQLLSYFTAPHNCSLSRGLFQSRFQQPVSLPSLRAGHGVEIIVTVVLGACRCPLSWMLYKYTDNASLQLKNW